jgi:hypothetical protein
LAIYQIALDGEMAHGTEKYEGFGLFAWIYRWCRKYII